VMMALGLATFIATTAAAEPCRSESFEGAAYTVCSFDPAIERRNLGDVPIRPRFNIFGQERAFSKRRGLRNRCRSVGIVHWRRGERRCPRGPQSRKDERAC
jgi:hypothetical protein